MAISSRDMDRSLCFYRDLLGFEQVLDFDWDVDNVVAPRVMQTGPSRGRAVLLRAGNAFLELFEFEQPEPRLRDAAWNVADHGITHLIDVDDVDAEYARLDAAGVRFHCPPQDTGTGIRTATGRDPDDNVFELQQVPGGGHKCALPPPFGGS